MYVPEETILDDQQHVEMCKIHSLLDEMASTELESVFSEGEQQGAHLGSTLRHVWEEDKRTQQETEYKSFQEDQMKNSELELQLYGCLMCILFLYSL